MTRRAKRPLGVSAEGRPIHAFTLGAGPPTILILAAMHGDEPKSVYVASRLLELLEADSALAGLARWVILPVVNPDGFARRKRRNASGVDINRNFPTRNWLLSSPRSRMYGGPRPASEPETRAVIRAVERFKPARIITIHSIDKHRFCNNYNGPARKLALAMKRCNAYPITATIGYPTPGSFGTWAGAERRIPTITLELPSHHSRQRCWLDNREALLAAAT